MARKSKKTLAEEAAKAEQGAANEQVVQWVNDVTEAITALHESLEATIDTINANAATGNELHETVSDNLVRIEANSVLLRGLRADMKLLRADVAACAQACTRADARITGLEAFEQFQRGVNGVNADRRQLILASLSGLEATVYAKEPTLWERIKARFSSDYE